MNNHSRRRRRRCCTFYDMKHSNNAARIRLWLRMNQNAIQSCEDSGDLVIKTLMLTHADIEADSYGQVNPLKKVPALVVEMEDDAGETTKKSNLHLFEASVIIAYLEDVVPNSVFKMSEDNYSTPEDRALLSLIVRCHDLYVSSPNCTQPNFSHTQGCMYLDPMPTPFTPARRIMDTKTRAAKLAELHQQLRWLENTARFMPYLCGEQVSHADLTWFPTAVFMELLLPKVFDWTPIFSVLDTDGSETSSEFPKLASWFKTCMENPHFAQTRREIRDTLIDQAERGRFAGVRNDVKAHWNDYKWKYI